MHLYYELSLSFLMRIFTKHLNHDKASPFTAHLRVTEINKKIVQGNVFKNFYK